ncbi:MAG: SpoIVB peptidase [Oscillospiraceae bacterium]|nr:SpoIVB peptidase [Oscillospiraceae bacterium]
MVKIKKSLIRFAAVCMVLLSLTQVTLAAGRSLIPVGDVVGISLETKGVLVVGFPDEDASAARDAGIKAGDVIVQIGDTPINCGIDVGSVKLGTEPIEITVVRDGAEKKITVTPRVGKSGNAELGLWMRDSLSGIGTVTFYDPETKTFGALGHGVNDIDTGVIMPIGGGVAADARVTEVIEGRCGIPGQLMGEFDYGSVVGFVSENTVFGIFGTVTDPSLLDTSELMETAAEDEVHIGAATIISCVDGKGPREFDVEIVKTDLDNREGHCFVLKVTDEELLEITGGIVQGMSGSPIIQDGKLVGAVTHVLVNQPDTGYGIFIENMLDAAG